MIRKLLSLFRRKRAVARRDVGVIIARRAVRLHNRCADGASAYERVHTILGAGRG